MSTAADNVNQVDSYNDMQGFPQRLDPLKVGNIEDRRNYYSAEAADAREAVQSKYLRQRYNSEDSRTLGIDMRIIGK